MSKPDLILKWGAEADPSIDQAFKDIVAKAKAAGGQVSRGLNEHIGGRGRKPEWAENLESQFGARSGIGVLGDALRGSGALLGITASADVLKSLAEGVEKIKHDFNDADKNAADMAQDLMQSIPVLKSIDDAGEAINELFTGQKESLAEAKSEAASLVQQLAIQKELFKENADFCRQIDETIEHIKAKTAEIGMPAFEAAQIDTQLAGDDQKKQVAQGETEQEKKIYDTARPGIDKLKQQIKDQKAIIARGFMVESMGMGPDAPPTLVEDTDAKQKAMDRLTDLENRQKMLEKNRDKQINTARSKSHEAEGAIDANTAKQLAQNKKEHDNSLSDEGSQSSIDAKKFWADEYQARLELQGRFYDAQIAGIKAGEEKDLAELKLARDKRERELTKGSADYLLAEKEYQEKKREITAKSETDQAKLVRQNQEQIADDRASHQMKSESANAANIEKYLRANGQSRGASQFQIGFQHYQAEEQIQDELRRNLRDHPERAAEFKKRAAEDVAADKTGLALDIHQDNAQAAERFRPQIQDEPNGETALLTGDVGLMGAAARTQGPPKDPGIDKLVGFGGEQTKILKAIENLLKGSHAGGSMHLIPLK